MKHTVSLYQRVMSHLIPEHFLSSRYAYHVNVLIVFSMTLGGLAFIILAGLLFAEGELPIRRVITISLASLLLLSILLIRIVSHVHLLAWYVILVSIALIWYVDFNNQSLAGPSSPLWIIPFALSGLLFTQLRLLLSSVLILSLAFLNGVLFFKGLLPQPLIPVGSWPTVQLIYIIAVGLVVIVCTNGITRLAHDQMDILQDQLEEKQKHLQQINELKVKAEASTNSKTLFLATVTHELRTPLNSVIGNAQLLENENLPAGAKARIEDISLAGRLLLTLINDILDFSKLEQRQLAFVETTYDLKHQIIHLCRMMESKLPKNVELKLTLPDESVFILADQSRVAQVLMNFLSNAFKFTSSGLIEMTLTPYKNGDIQLAVTDTGTGIREADIKKLFNQFSQVAEDSAKNTEGTGLGLAICKGIVEQMNGRIDVASVMNEGSQFSVYLPKRIQLDHTDNAALVIEETLNLKDVSILIVDDIDMNCIVLQGMIETFNANKIFTVNSGEDAVEFLHQYSDTQVVLMDVRMPSMSGVEATRIIREQGYKGVIIAVTANATQEDQAECLEAGMDDFLSKPVEMSGLKQALLKALH